MRDWIDDNSIYENSNDVISTDVEIIIDLDDIRLIVEDDSVDLKDPFEIDWAWGQSDNGTWIDDKYGVEIATAEDVVDSTLDLIITNIPYNQPDGEYMLQGSVTLVFNVDNIIQFWDNYTGDYDYDIDDVDVEYNFEDSLVNDLELIRISESL